MNVVLDNNILISALGWINGNEATVLDLCYKDRIKLLLSPDLLKEFDSVVLRDKFGFSLSEIEDFVDSLIKIGIFVNPKERVNIAIDEDDNRILELAYEGKAEYIVTGDDHLLKIKEFKGIKILKASEFLKLF